MSLLVNLKKLVENAVALVEELPVTKERRKIEIGFEKVQSALEKIPEDSTMEDVKDAVEKECIKDNCNENCDGEKCEVSEAVDISQNKSLSEEEE